MLKWNVGVIIFLRERHFSPETSEKLLGNICYLPVEIRSPVPSHGTRISYSGPFVMMSLLSNIVWSNFAIERYSHHSLSIYLGDVRAYDDDGRMRSEPENGQFVSLVLELHSPSSHLQQQISRSPLHLICRPQKRNRMRTGNFTHVFEQVSTMLNMFQHM